MPYVLMRNWFQENESLIFRAFERDSERLEDIPIVWNRFRAFDGDSGKMFLMSRKNDENSA
jgi:hypothetical protein